MLKLWGNKHDKKHAAQSVATIQAVNDNVPKQGVFITFEGGDGVGKSTHIRFLAELLKKRGYEVVNLREPGGTTISEHLRELVLNPEHTALCPRAELLMYEAARAQLIDEVIRPALSRGAIVLCDRFTDSTLAYQGFGRGLSKDFIQAANTFASDRITPDKTILLVCDDAQTALERAMKHSEGDRLEQAGVDFHEKALQGFTQLAKENPKRIAVIPSQAKRSDTARAILNELVGIFPWINDELEQNADLFAAFAAKDNEARDNTAFQDLEQINQAVLQRSTPSLTLGELLAYNHSNDKQDDSSEHV